MIVSADDDGISSEIAFRYCLDECRIDACRLHDVVDSLRALMRLFAPKPFQKRVLSIQTALDMYDRIVKIKKKTNLMRSKKLSEASDLLFFCDFRRHDMIDVFLVFRI